jgi:membrane protein DedA with SNARE-associated domain
MAIFCLVPGCKIFVALSLGSSGGRPTSFFVFELIGCTSWAAVLVKFGLLFLATLRELSMKKRHNCFCFQSYF